MKRRLSFTAVALCLAASFAIPAMAQISGSIDTTVSTGGLVNVNLFQNKADVYINGGPQNQNASGLPPGTYYFQVTNPSGAVLLSDDAAICRQLTVDATGRVVGFYDNGGTISCHHANGSFDSGSGTTPVQLGDPTTYFTDTPNNGGVYKAWLISQDSSIGCATTVDLDGIHLIIPNGCTKTDNFRIKASSDCTSGCTTPQSLISGLKFYDKGFNGSYISGVYTPPSAPNGTFDAGEAVLPNWTITFTGVNNTVPFTDTLTTGGGGDWADLSDVGSTITVCEVLQSGWSQSGPILNTNIAGITAQAIGTGTQGPICWSGTVPATDVSNLNFGNYEAVSGTKYYDLDVSNTPTAGDTTIQGFKITFCDAFTGNVCSPTSGVAFTGAGGNYTFYLQSPGERFQIGEVLPSVNGWSQTGPLSGALPSPTNTGNGTVAGTGTMNWLAAANGGGSANGLYFTNVCEGTDVPFTLGYWGAAPPGKAALSANFPGWASGLNTEFPNTATNLALITGGAKTIPIFSTSSSSAAYSELSGFLIGATGSNAANMLSAQAATMALNTLVLVSGKKVSSSDLMLLGITAQLTAAKCIGGALTATPPSVTVGGYASISSVLGYVESLLLAYPNTTGASNARTCEAFVQTALNNANNNFAATIIKPAACSVTFPY